MIVPVNIPAGFLVDTELAGYIILAKRTRDGTVPLPVQIAVEQGDFGLMASTETLPPGFFDLISVRNILTGRGVPVAYYHSFFGRIRRLAEPSEPVRLVGPSKPLLVMLPRNKLDYFRRPYEDMPDMMAEFMGNIMDLLPGLPEQGVVVDLPRRLISVMGTAVT